MTWKQRDKSAAQPKSDRDPSRWLGIGGGVALVLAVLAVLLAWQHASDERRSAEDVKARVAAEMNRIEAEAARIEREAGQ
ncbi:hypothetical protein PIB19_10660 [Sphingomonas sp. 7/4-4]|uniref:hypothetical protein n=1 Tax=Sphingomonas sp. 7/4-4 TaxID=3018446 RepID=UPI0022F3ED4E|nr:hypothetical protein [Sphingomonas sp. 7/4-4]WBY09694.1 hypothetical protein PIB19_10660 [Sphingomonas sp. 7/4-4]